MALPWSRGGCLKGGWGVLFLLFFLLSPITSHAAVLSKAPNNLGLVGYRKFDEGVGAKAGDSSGRGNTGTEKNAKITE
ncbi:MAG: hypothetical protein AAB837_00020 [Patescibacteria group bacterium]